jgi:hypothetical protein
MFRLEQIASDLLLNRRTRRLFPLIERKIDWGHDVLFEMEQTAVGSTTYSTVIRHDNAHSPPHT